MILFSTLSCAVMIIRFFMCITAFSHN
uniref:Uncharacterized protein n=1 Tax=Arundo donax TaxID=35708 RepID=A0A0A9CG44_ARUDO